MLYGEAHAYSLSVFLTGLPGCGCQSDPCQWEACGGGAGAESDPLLPASALRAQQGSAERAGGESCTLVHTHTLLVHMLGTASQCYISI